ncbi:MAG: hypothetical protein U0Q18_13900 [Bryobacteraceae bacterium]
MRSNAVSASDQRPDPRRLIEEGRYGEAERELLIYCRELEARLKQAEGKAQIESLQAEWDELLARTRTCVLAGRAHAVMRCQELRTLQRFLNSTKSGHIWSLLG